MTANPPISRSANFTRLLNITLLINLTGASKTAWALKTAFLTIETIALLRLKTWRRPVVGDGERIEEGVAVGAGEP